MELSGSSVETPMRKSPQMGCRSYNSSASARLTAWRAFCCFVISRMAQLGWQGTPSVPPRKHLGKPRAIEIFYEVHTFQPFYRPGLLLLQVYLLASRLSGR